ncbi:MAG: ATP-binding cassette domain-containing protein [Salibacteraceae bacterium]
MQLTEQLTPLQRFCRLLRPDRKDIRNVYVYAIFNGLINLSLPLGIQAIVNLIQGGQINTSWIVLVAIVVMGVGLSGVLQIFQLRIVENLQQKIFTRAAFEFAYRIPKIRLEALYQKYAPELMNRFFDVMSVQKGLTKILIDFSAAILQMIFGLILLSFYHPFFILFSLVLLIFVAIVFRLTASIGLAKSLEESKFKYKVAYWLEELARTANTFKLSGNSTLSLQRTDKAVNKYLEAREAHFSVLVRQYSLMVVFKVIIVTGLLAIGGILVMEQLMNIGQFVAAEIIILLIINSVEKLVLSIETIYDVLTGLEKIGQVTDLELENDEGIDLSEQCLETPVYLELDNVSFSYPGSRKRALDNVSFEIASNERVMITGGNLSGKSTLLQIVAGLYDPTDGTIMYQGLAKKSISSESLRSIMGDCLSQEQLFEGSILENLTLANPAVSLNTIKDILRDLGINEFIKSLPNGLEEQIEPQGTNLPRSVAQLLLIARSVSRNPKLILLEDALEHLDEEHRMRVIDYITDKKHNWTLMAVSTDTYLARKSDRIILMEGGAIIAQGTYDEMKSKLNLKNNGHA